MTKAEYLAFHRDCVDRMIEITKRKNADYTGTGDDPFANFTRVEALEIASTEQGFLTRMVDKLSRINSFRQRGFMNVTDESVEDTLLDLANYSILFAGYLKKVRSEFLGLDKTDEKMEEPHPLVPDYDFQLIPEAREAAKLRRLTDEEAKHSERLRPELEREIGKLSCAGVAACKAPKFKAVSRAKK